MGLNTQILSNNPNLPNDSKLLDGWVADMSQLSPSQLAASVGIQISSTTSPNISMTNPTDLSALQGTYTIFNTFGSPNGSGNGYFGVELETTVNGTPEFILVNRQFRLTSGSTGDTVTDAENVLADLVGIQTSVNRGQSRIALRSDIGCSHAS